MEIRGILVAAVTIYCGLCYLTDDLNEGSKITLFCIMVTANAYFLLIFIVKFWNEFSFVIASKAPFPLRIKPSQ
jgi:hypothetical protein